MYDIPFSEQWMLDLALSEINGLLVFVFFPLLAVFIGIFLAFKTTNSKKQLVGAIISVIFAAIVAYIIYGFIIMLIGYGVFQFSMSTFYRGVHPAHAIHAQIKQRISENRNIPQNLKDLQEMDPTNYKEMTQYAKVNYIYDPKTKNYTFFVRPSKHGIVIFDSKKDYKIYDFDVIFKTKSKPTSVWEGSYPPNYPGPWENLPQ